MASNLAGALLRYAPTSEVTDALLPVSTLEGTAVLNCSPSTATARTQAGRGVHYAATLAAGSSDPATLTALAKRPQKSVKRLVAANPHLPVDAAEPLIEWAIQNRDLDTCDALFTTIPPAQWILQMAATGWYYGTDDSAEEKTPYGRLGHRYPVDRIVDQLARTGDSEQLWRTWMIGIVPINRAIAAAAAAGTVPAVVADLLAVTSETSRLSIIEAVLASKPDILPDVIVDELVTTADALDTWPAPYLATLVRARPLTGYAIAAFLGSGHQRLIRAVLAAAAAGHAHLDDTQFDAAAADATGVPAAVLLSSSQLRQRLTVAQINRLAEVCDRSEAEPRALLTERGAELEPATITALLRCGNHTLTKDWMTGKLGAPVTPEALQLLAANPGLALRSMGYGSSTDDSMVDDVASMIRWRFNTAFHIEDIASPSLRVVLNEAGPATLTLAAHDDLSPRTTATNVFAAYLAGEIAMRFGPNPTAWATAAQLAERLQLRTGTVTDFLDVVASMMMAAPTS